MTIVNLFFTTIFSSDRSSCFQVVSLNSLFNLYTVFTINTSEPRASSSRFVSILVESFLEVLLLGAIATSSPTSTDFGVKSGIGGVSSFLAWHNAIFLCYLIWDDRHRNTNMNNKDHLVGQLTTSFPSLSL